MSAACSANGPVGRYVAEDHSRNALLLDDRPAEDKIIADGYGVVRLDAMYDDFVIVGPIFDPAGTRGLNDTSKAFAQIAATGALFAIRGDDSSTDRLELRLLEDPLEPQPCKQAAWDRDVAQGLEEKLNLAVRGARPPSPLAGLGAFHKPRRFRDPVPEGFPVSIDFGGHPRKPRLLHAGKIRLRADLARMAHE